MSGSRPEIELTMMRHGRSAADDEGVIEGRYDSPLTAVGREQAAQRGQQFAREGRSFDALIASPLRRAAESASIVGHALGLVPESDPQWMERDNGPVAGLTIAEAGSRYPRPEREGPWDPLVPTAREGESRGESLWGMHARIVSAVESIVQRGPGRYLVVAHGGAIGTAIRIVAGTPPRMGSFRVPLGDLGFVRLEYDLVKDQWTLRELGQGLENPPTRQ